jgi:ribosomal protein L37E
MEDALVCQYMCKYGINNVRGGTFSNVNLREDQRERIDPQLRHQGNTCFNVGSPNHFATSCPKISVGGNQILRDGNETSRNHGTRRRLKCTRCGRNSKHTEKDCFAFTDVDGDVLMRDVDDDAVDDRDHISIESDSRCARCGRDSHSQSNCYASTHIEGRSLPSIIDLSDD